MRPGDVVLTPASGGFGNIVSTVTWSRYSHVSLVVDHDGTTISANRSGAEWDGIYEGDVVVSPPLSDVQRDLIHRAAVPLIGTPYGYRDVVALGLARMGFTSASLARQVERPDRLFCSQLVDLIWRRVGFHAFDDGRLPQAVTPGDIADLALRKGWDPVDLSDWEIVYTP
uniref:Nicotinamide mononucleotide transporter n=1 Tax=Arthrobacter phage SWEP2 TaxID=2945958 RepID=A0A9E7SI19_9CAUD